MFRTKKTQGEERPSVLIQLRLTDTNDVPIDASYAWEELNRLFKDHKHLEIFQVEIRPDKDAKTSI